ncbi:hypothetical protein Glove_131g92 [Diversispora epigaea]|uniref:F-box domain-containing protein n=1 Tax=Diversispora epigaea TaxID=1348612 RepID=A0A397J4B2_9GLOM|nr:hypothetical protein Glove_131g92 [Diversispora epigaea]
MLTLSCEISKVSVTVILDTGKEVVNGLGLKIDNSSDVECNLLNLLPPELIPFITKYLPIQDLKKCCSLDDIWKTEAIREIRKRLIMDCTFVDKNTTVKALIDPKFQHDSISKTLAKKMDLYIFREYGSRYPAVIDLDIGATNAGKKVMRRDWIDREKVSVTLPNIFDDIVPPSYLGIDTANFVVVDKPEYDLVLGHVWLMYTGYRVDRYKKPPLYINRSKDIEEQELEKSQYRARNSIWELPLSLHTFYKLLFPKFIAIESDGETIITKFSKHKRDFDGLNEYYDSEYSETKSESSDSETESEFSDSEIDVPFPVIIGTIQDNNRAKGKIPVKALIDTTFKSNTISRCLYSKLESDHRLEEYSETKSESSDSETESEFSDSEIDVPFPVIIGTIQDNNRAKGKIPVKALIDTTFKSNTISRCLYSKLESDHRLEGIPDEDIIVIDFQIRKNPSFDLVLRQDWLWAHEVKISFKFSSGTYEQYGIITDPKNHCFVIIDGMSIPLIEEGSTPTGSSLSHKVSSTKNRRISKIKKYPKIDLGNGGGNLLIKIHLNNIWKSVYSIENDIEYRIFEKLCIIEYELSCINKAKLPWVNSETETSSSSSDSEPTDSGRYKLQKDRMRNTKKNVVSPIRKHRKNNLSKSTESKPGPTLEEVMDIINKSLSDIKDNKHRKKQHEIFESKKASRNNMRKTMGKFTDSPSQYMNLFNPHKYEHTYNPGNNFVIVENKSKGSIVDVFDYTELYVYLEMHHLTLLA